MGDKKSTSASFYNRLKSSSNRKYLALTLLVVVLLFLFSGGFGLLNSFGIGKIKEVGNFCGDGTFYNSCSSVKPYFCKDGKLTELASHCGCPAGFTKKGNLCTSSYGTNPKEISLKYILRGQEGYINFTVYEGVANYVSKVPRSIRSTNGDSSSRADFKLKAINEEEQKKFLEPLVIKIQNITNDKQDQLRIAISLVQNIPFGASNKTSIFGSNKVAYSRYPYEVLYDMKGICGEKTDLLAFISRDIGYGVGLFYYPTYNHEALGIKCPIKESIMESGYCFVETTGPAIITDNKISYISVGKLYDSPEVFSIASGISMQDNLYEYGDAQKIIRIREAIEKRGKINFFRHLIYKNLEEKYGLINSYYSQ